MVDQSQMLAGIDVSTPNVARMYDYYLGGKDNYAADRAAAEKVLAVAPEASALALLNRAFLGRAVRFLAESGIRQFLDVGTGLPTQYNVHQVAQQVNPSTRVVYVDNDPVVVTHGRALLVTDAATAMISGDLRRPEELIGDPRVRELLDLDEPVAVLLVSVLHCLTADDDPWAVVVRIREALAPGSYLVLSHITAGDRAEAAEQGAQVYRKEGATTSMTLRSRDQIEAFFEGFELVEPGLVALSDWRPDPPAPDSPPAEGMSAAVTADQKLPTWFLCGVGRKT